MWYTSNAGDEFQVGIRAEGDSREGKEKAKAKEPSTVGAALHMKTTPQKGSISTSRAKEKAKVEEKEKVKKNIGRIRWERTARSSHATSADQNGTCRHAARNQVSTSLVQSSSLKNKETQINLLLHLNHQKNFNDLIGLTQRWGVTLVLFTSVLPALPFAQIIPMPFTNEDQQNQKTFDAHNVEIICRPWERQH